MSVAPRSEAGEAALADLAEYLAHRGLKTTSELIANAANAPIDEILAASVELDADLILMGAYGHSRTRELVLGGMTQTCCAR